MAAGCRNGTQRMHRHLWAGSKPAGSQCISPVGIALARTAYGQRVLAYTHYTVRRSVRVVAEPVTTLGVRRTETGRRLRELFQPRALLLHYCTVLLRLRRHYIRTEFDHSTRARTLIDS